MAKVAIAGIEGSFSLTGHNARVARWSADNAQDVNDASGFGQQPWRANLGGMRQLSGEASGYLEANAASSAPAADYSASNDQTGVAFVLTAKTGCTYTGTCIVSNIRTSTDINGNAMFMCSFKSTGVVVEAWAVS